MSEPSVSSTLSSYPCQSHAASLHRNILAGSYDANVRIFDGSQNPIYTITGHTAPVTSVCWVGEERLIASASHDRTVRLVRVPEVHDGSPTTLASLYLHTAPVSSVASDRQGTRLLTASWDTFIGVWTTSIPDTDEVSMEHATTEDRKKRRKVTEDARPVRKVCVYALIIFLLTNLSRKAPEHVMKSHTGRVSRALFSPLASAEYMAYSCGLDSTFRSWDTNNGVCASTIARSILSFIYI